MAYLVINNQVTDLLLRFEKNLILEVKEDYLDKVFSERFNLYLKVNDEVIHVPGENNTSTKWTPFSIDP